MFTKNRLVLVFAGACLTGCASVERTPVMTLQEADNYQVNCQMKNEQIEFLSRYVMDNTKPAYHMNARAQGVIRRKIDYLYSWCK